MNNTTCVVYDIMFCEGVGKGVIGAITLPASGVIDLGTRAFESVHR